MEIETQPKPSQSLISLEDFLVLPETKPANEYINGNIFQKPMPQGQHSTLQGKLFALKHGTKLGWLIAPQERAVLSFQGDRFNSHRDEDLLPVLEDLTSWQISVNDLFKLLSFARKAVI